MWTAVITPVYITDERKYERLITDARAAALVAGYMDHDPRVKDRGEFLEMTRDVYVNWRVVCERCMRIMRMQAEADARKLKWRDEFAREMQQYSRDELREDYDKMLTEYLFTSEKVLEDALSRDGCDAQDIGRGILSNYTTE